MSFDTSMATIGGDCDSCHNLYPGMMEKTHTGKAFQYVLKNEFCVNCHSSANSETIKSLGGNRVPVVHNTVNPIHPLAGGNFRYVAKDFGDRKGHNVDGITSVELREGRMSILLQLMSYARVVMETFTARAKKKTITGSAIHQICRFL